jgi:hypothetical protein
MFSIKTGETNKKIHTSGRSIKAQIDLWNEFGVDISDVIDESYDPQSETTFIRIFEEVWKQTNQMFSGYNKTKEREYLLKFIKGLEHVSSRSDTGVNIIHFKKNDFELYNVENIGKKLIDSEYDLECVMDRKSTRKQEEIYIKDKNTDKKLITFRLEIRDGNKVKGIVIEKDVLFDELAKSDSLAGS